MELKLKLHLIPSSAFYCNLKNKLGMGEWKKISTLVREKKESKCQFCGWVEDKKRKQYTHTHEEWEFIDGEQRLVDFECVCAECHKVHHWGRSSICGLNFEYLIKHACKVNRCTRSEFERHVEESFLEWEERSKTKWTMNINKLDEILLKYSS